MHGASHLSWSVLWAEGLLLVLLRPIVEWPSRQVELTRQRLWLRRRRRLWLPVYQQESVLVLSVFDPDR